MELLKKRIIEYKNNYKELQTFANSVLKCTETNSLIHKDMLVNIAIVCQNLFELERDITQSIGEFDEKHTNCICIDDWEEIASRYERKMRIAKQVKIAEPFLYLVSDNSDVMPLLEKQKRKLKDEIEQAYVTGIFNEEHFNHYKDFIDLIANLGRGNSDMAFIMKSAMRLVPMFGEELIGHAISNRNIRMGEVGLGKVDEEYDRYGFDEQGIDRKGFDIYGFDEDGYNILGYAYDGFNRENISKDGHHKNEYDADGYHLTTGFNVFGYDRDGYDSNGFDRNGYNVYGYDKDGYSKNGYNLEGYDHSGYDEQGLDAEGYDRNGRNIYGYDRRGFNEKGYDAEGYGRDGFNRFGYNREGRDRDGYDVDGYDAEGNKNHKKIIEEERIENFDLENKLESQFYDKCRPLIMKELAPRL